MSPPPRTRLRVARMLAAETGLPLSEALELDGLAGKDPFEYARFMRRVAYNLCANPPLSTIPAEQLAEMDDAAMASGTPLQRLREAEEQQIGAMHRILRENADLGELGNSGLRCRSCGSFNVTWAQRQTRGADEAMTIFCTCSDCKKRWRM